MSDKMCGAKNILQPSGIKQISTEEVFHMLLFRVNVGLYYDNLPSTWMKSFSSLKMLLLNLFEIALA